MRHPHILPLFLAVVLTGCSPDISRMVGRYRSVCRLYDRPSLEMVLNGDGTFEYKIAYLDETVTGTWRLEGSSVILESEYFSEGYLEDRFPDYPEIPVPRYKFTNMEDRDMYVFRRGRLLVVEDWGVRKTCHLFKVD